MKRKFPKVPKTKKGVPLKYVRGAKNPKAREAEIKRTAKLYKNSQIYAIDLSKESIAYAFRKTNELKIRNYFTKKEVRYVTYDV